MATVRRRYQNDVAFSRVVDMLRACLSQYHLTPSELREAAMLAACMHEMDNPRSVYLRTERTIAELEEMRGRTR